MLLGALHKTVSATYQHAEICVAFPFLTPFLVWIFVKFSDSDDLSPSKKLALGNFHQNSLQISRPLAENNGEQIHSALPQGALRFWVALGAQWSHWLAYSPGSGSQIGWPAWAQFCYGFHRLMPFYTAFQKNAILKGSLTQKRSLFPWCSEDAQLRPNTSSCILDEEVQAQFSTNSAKQRWFYLATNQHANMQFGSVASMHSQHLFCCALGRESGESSLEPNGISHLYSIDTPSHHASPSTLLVGLLGRLGEWILFRLQQQCLSKHVRLHVEVFLYRNPVSRNICFAH